MQRLWWLNEESRAMLSRGYLLEGETPEMAIDRVATTATKILNKPEIYQKIKDNIEYGWMSLSSPIWSNFGAARALPISCYGSYCKDSVSGISESLSEVIMQTKDGGGCSVYFGNVRPRGAVISTGGKSNGSVSFMRLFDTAISVISQSSVRRGSMAAYLNVDHGDIEEFLEIKDIGHDIQNLFIGVNIPDYWMREMIDGDKNKRKIWAKIITCRKEKGLPYINFIDTVNNNAPQVYKDKGLKIVASNLCAEITLHSSEDESFVCCLSSMNAETYDEWKNTDAIETATYLLDAVMEEFINKTEGSYGMERAHNFAKRQRAIGLGILGYHSYLQKNMVPFESIEAKSLNHEIFKLIRDKSLYASQCLAKEYGEPELLKGYGIRNATRTAVAPTTSSSSILGQTSQSIEPISSNYFKVGLAKGSFIRKNKYLQKLLEEKGHDTDEVWDSILLHAGSVQHLDFLSDREKSVFKTFKEISQIEILIQGSTRQRFICQSQSLNVNIPPGVTAKEINQLYIKAWELGIKSLYYQRSQSVSKEMARNILACTSCEA